VIIWLNGPFGVGKTTTAELLVSRCPDWVIADTEHVGYLLRPMLDDREPVRDFQDWSSWRRLVVATLVALHEQLSTTIVVPQTVITETYWREIATGLTDAGIPLVSITLDVSNDEHERRVAADLDEHEAAPWRRERLKDFAAARPWLARSAVMLDTSELTPTEVVDRVVREAESFDVRQGNLPVEPAQAAPPELRVWGIPGIPEIEPGDDLPRLIADTARGAGVEPGDILAVTSKIVSKAEGRIVVAADREQAITDETVRVVATRTRADGGTTRIVENRLGLVMAAAGVDASNTADGIVLLLPVDPDASAAAIRAAVEEAVGAPVGVIITDTAGRAWREGQTDMAIGASGVALLDDLRGSRDAAGKLLEVTAPAVGDEIAAAADLVKGKSSGIPVAAVRGLARLLDDTAPGARSLVRPAEDDLFSLGTKEAWDEGFSAGAQTINDN
jgi:coenzyme F420-0:L-glutamate ligase/coenzyme F420-1:gamma-L-glutamate ligase